MRHMLASLHSRYDRSIVEQAAIAGALHPIGGQDEAEAAALAAGYRRTARSPAPTKPNAAGKAMSRMAAICLRGQVRGVRQAGGARRRSPDLGGSAPSSRTFRVFAGNLRTPGHLRALDRGTPGRWPGGSARSRHGGRSKGHFADATLIKASRDEPGTTLGDDARPATPVRCFR